MKTINGLPTMKSLYELCDKHGLKIRRLEDTYKRTGSIVFSRESQNEIAEKVSEEIAQHFKTEFRKSEYLTNGLIRISKKDS